MGCLLYTSDAADERSSVDLGGRRIIKEKKKKKKKEQLQLQVISEAHSFNTCRARQHKLHLTPVTTTNVSDLSIHNVSARALVNKT